MQFSTSCPACGASISLTSDSSHVSCPYCNRDFDVDLSETTPVFKPAAGKPKEYTPSLEPEITEPVVTTAQSEGFSPVQEPAPVQEIAAPVAEERPSYAAFEPPTASATPAKKVTEKLGKWLWVLIIMLGLMCVSCVALIAIGASLFLKQ